jgi:acetyl esterase/lipase
LSVLLACLLFLPVPAGQVDESKSSAKHEVEIVGDIAYMEGPDADPNRHKLDLYLPRGKRDFPVLFFVHGGSWRSGDRKLYAPLGQVFARNGVGTVIISYRLSPAVKHPAHIQDVARAYGWTCRNISKHGGRADEIFACGHSAGGHLVALLGTDERWLQSEKLSFSHIRGVIPISGVYSITVNPFLEHAFGKDMSLVKEASPLTHVREKLCPFCIIYAESEYPTLDLMAVQMHKALEGCKCDASICKVPGRTHETIIRNAAASDTDPTTQHILAFIARHSSRKQP